MTQPDERPREPRAAELEVEVTGTPEEVWAAIATGPGITAWLHPTELEEREGGRMTFDMGAGLVMSATVTGWEPPRRFCESAEWRVEGEEPATLATEWTITARSGDRCVVRMVTSGFGAGTGWDEEIEGFTDAMRAALEGLRLYLAHHSGREGTWTRVFGTAPGSRAEAWAALTSRLGLAHASEGDEVRAQGEQAPALAGTVGARIEDTWMRSLRLRVDEPAPGLATVALWGEANTTTVQLCLYGEEGAAAARREQDAWRAWMESNFPPARP